MRYFETKPAAGFEFADISYEKGDWVARITINRPHNYNAYSTRALDELAAAFRDAPAAMSRSTKQTIPRLRVTIGNIWGYSKLILKALSIQASLSSPA
jgi:hypothetical protein